MTWHLIDWFNIFHLGSRSSSPCNLHPWLKSQYGGCASSTKCRGTVSKTCCAGSAAGVPARWFYPGCCTGWAAGLDSTKEDYTTVSYTPIHYVTGLLTYVTYLLLELVGHRFCEPTKFGNFLVYDFGTSPPPPIHSVQHFFFRFLGSFKKDSLW